jgi:hypothetical protein
LIQQINFQVLAGRGLFIFQVKNVFEWLTEIIQLTICLQKILFMNVYSEYSITVRRFTCARLKAEAIECIRFCNNNN